MSRGQKTIVAAGLAVVTLLLLFPPWYMMGKGSHLNARISRGYHLSFSPPCCDPHIDFARYLVPVGVVCAMTLLAFLEMKDARREKGV